MALPCYVHNILLVLIANNIIAMVFDGQKPAFKGTTWCCKMQLNKGNPSRGKRLNTIAKDATLR
eukprot:15365055-Ditylum_brightwellii.AAC.1